MSSESVPEAVELDTPNDHSVDEGEETETETPETETGDAEPSAPVEPVKPGARPSFHSVVQSLPEAEREVVTSLQKEYKRLANERAQLRKEIAELRAKVPTEEVEFDPYDPIQRAAEVERVIAQREAEKAKEAAKAGAAQAFNSFLEAHPELDPDTGDKDLVAFVLKTLKEDPSMTTIEAYYAYEGASVAPSPASQASKAADLKRQQKARAEAVQRRTPGQAPVVKPLDRAAIRKMSPAEFNRYIASLES